MIPKLLLLVLPALVASNPAASPYASPNPQTQLNMEDAFRNIYDEFWYGEHDCWCEDANVQCAGTECECSNITLISCYIKSGGKCKLWLNECKALNGALVSPTPLQSEFPPCAVGLPQYGCASGKSCHKIDENCANSGNNYCVGACVPVIASGQQLPSGSLPSGQLSSGSLPSGQLSSGRLPSGQMPAGNVASAPQKLSNGCPAGYGCEQGNVCIMNPRKPADPIAGAAYMCVKGTDVCGGWAETQCAKGMMCVPDPRMNCFGGGCTGLCA